MNLKEFAELLGLSQTTVSRALNGYPEVSEATRARVMAAAQQHNYRANTRAKALATGRSMTIAHVLPVSTRHEMVNPVFANFIAGASEAYTRAGYDLVLSVVGDDAEEPHYRDIAAKRTVDGMIVHAPRPDDRRIALLQSVDLPFVVHGRATRIDADYSWVDMNNLRAFRRATEFLMDLGHHRIALVNGLEIYDFAQRRRAGYVEALAARGLDADPALMLSDEMTEQYGYTAARHLMAQDDPPSAIVASSTIIAFGIHRAVVEAGLVLGRDISLITHDDVLAYFKNGDDEPLFTAIRSSVWEAGKRAAAALIDQIENPGKRHQIMLEADFVIGRSTGPEQSPASRQRKA
jgi:LacI family transcriptional regulator